MRDILFIGYDEARTLPTTVIGKFADGVLIAAEELARDTSRVVEMTESGYVVIRSYSFETVERVLVDKPRLPKEPPLRHSWEHLRKSRW